MQVDKYRYIGRQIDRQTELWCPLSQAKGTHPTSRRQALSEIQIMRVQMFSGHLTALATLKDRAICLAAWEARIILSHGITPCIQVEQLSGPCLLWKDSRVRSAFLYGSSALGLNVACEILPRLNSNLTHALQFSAIVLFYFPRPVPLAVHLLVPPLLVPTLVQILWTTGSLNSLCCTLGYRAKSHHPCISPEACRLDWVLCLSSQLF